MTTSGSFDWSLTRDEIITKALEKTGAIKPGDTPSAAQVTAAATTLNAMVKSWQNRGVFLWTVEWVTKTLSASDTCAGTDGNTYTCIRSHTSATSNRPVTGANWSTVWRLRGSGGAAWTDATSYSSVGDFAVAGDTIGVEKAFIRRNDYADLPLEIIGRDEYLDIPDKTAEGLPSYLHFNQRLTPQIFLWPIPNDTTDVLHVLRVRMLEDFDAAEDNADFPSRWLRALIYGLAFDLADDMSEPSDIRDRLERKSEILFLQAKAGDREPSDDESIDGAYEV